MINQKAKISRYEVTVTRVIEHTAVVEVDARSITEAKQVAEDAVDNIKPSPWREGDLVDGSTKAKLIGGTSNA